MVSSTPSFARASATLNAAGPGTVAVTVFESLRPASVHTDPAAVQSDAAGRLMVTSSYDAGRTAMVQRRFWPRAARLASTTRPFPISNAWSRKVR